MLLAAKRFLSQDKNGYLSAAQVALAIFLPRDGQFNLIIENLVIGAKSSFNGIVSEDASGFGVLVE
jgi:hypothetical protein